MPPLGNLPLMAINDLNFSFPSVTKFIDSASLLYTSGFNRGAIMLPGSKRGVRYDGTDWFEVGFVLFCLSLLS